MFNLCLKPLTVVTGENNCGKSVLIRHVMPAVSEVAYTEPWLGAIQPWLARFGLGELAVFTDENKTRIWLGTTEINYQGLGVKNLTSVLIRSLAAHPCSTLWFEYPDAYLSIEKQRVLGEFFVTLAEMQKKIIVETQSPTLIRAVQDSNCSNAVIYAVHNLTKVDILT